MTSKLDAARHEGAKLEVEAIKNKAKADELDKTITKAESKFKAQASISPWDLEAIQIAKADFNKHWQKCGDSYYAEYSEKNPNRFILNFYEQKGVKEPIIKFKTTPNFADNLNGLEWKGTVIFTADAFRHYQHEEWGSDGWSPWSEEPRGFWNYSIERTNGVWKVKCESCGIAGVYLDWREVWVEKYSDGKNGKMQINPARCGVFEPGQIEAEIQQRK
jgi:hypothetical protein